MITVMYAQSNDRWIRSDSSTYGNVLFGNNLQVNTDDIGVAGQTYSSGTYYVRQYFVQFNYSRDPGLTPVSGFFRFHNNVTHGTNVSRSTEIREYDWGASVDTSDWRRPSMLEGSDVSGRLENSHNFANNTPVYAGFMRLRGELTNSSATLRYFLATDRNRRQVTPRGVEYNSFRSTRADGTDQDPMLVIGHHTQNRLTTVLSSQVQLSDGSWIYLERDDTLDDALVLTVKHRTTSGESTVYEFPPASGILENDNFRGAQGFGLCRDKNDNFFVIRPAYNNTTQIQIRPFLKESGHSWTLGGELSFAALSDHGYSNIMQVVCAWHDVGSGRIVACATRDWGQLGGAMESYYLLDAQRILDGQSNFVLDSGRGGYDGFTARPPSAGQWSPLNGTGTLSDIVAAPDHPRVGYFLSGERHALLGENNSLSLSRYFIHSDGGQFNSYTFAELDTGGGYSVYDPDAKARVIGIDGLNAVKITADARGDWGITVDRFSFNTNNNNRSRIGQVRLGSELVPSLPDANVLSTTAAWDAVYYPVDNKIWVYYFDRDNSRRLMRTAISLDDNLATLEEVEVAVLGSSGDTFPAIRVQRNNVTSDHVLLTVARISGGVHHYEYVTDRINVAPTQPSLDPVVNYSAVTDKTFTWRFQDPNIEDHQTAYQFRILRQSDSSVVHDTGWVNSSAESYLLPGGSIDNDENYFWQVRVRDSVGAESPWSAQGSFGTSDSGVVNITEPATDLEEIFVKDVLVKWSLTGSEQQEYRVVVVRVSDLAVHLDTGWVVSAASSHIVPNLASDVEYQVRVRTRNNLVESNLATRRILTHYVSPETPSINVVVTPGVEYVQIEVTNPEPRGDRPNPTVNEIYRRLAGSGAAFQLIGETVPHGTFRDYSVGSGYMYEYKVRAGVEG